MIIYKLYFYVLKPSNIEITVLSNLKLGCRCTKIFRRANTRSKLILKSLLSHDPTTLHMHLLPKTSQNWDTFNRFGVFIINLILILSKIYSAHLRKMCRLCNPTVVSYYERLNFLSLQRLKVRGIYTDLIFMHKLAHNTVSSVGLKRTVNNYTKYQHERSSLLNFYRTNS